MPSTAANAAELATVIQQDNTSNTADTIQLTGGVNDYHLTGQLEITDTAGLTIQGQGQILDAGGHNRAFLIDKGGTDVVFQNLTIQGGMATDDGTGGSNTVAEGGGILDKGGSVTLSKVVLQSNKAVAGTGLNAYGGGIYAENGSLTIQSSLMQSNSVQGGDTSSPGNGGFAYGGGIYTKGTTILNVTDSTLSSNRVKGGSDSAGDGGPAFGGGIYSENGATITDSSLSNNNLTGGTGSDIGGPAYGGGIYAVGKTTITGSNLSGNTLTGGNGGSGHGGDAQGGSVYASNATTTISGCILSNNNLTGGDGTGGGYAGFVAGGGLYADSISTVTISDSTLSGNTILGGSASGGSDQPGAFGGGAYLAGTDNQIVNSTVADNQAIGSKNASTSSIAYSGGLFFDSTATATLTNVTVAGNKASLPSGGTGNAVAGGIDNDGGAVTLVNTLVAGNSADSNSPDYKGSISTGSGHNLIGIKDGSSGFSAANGDLLGTSTNPLDPHLGPLQNNGGKTQTLALLPGSPAINAGNNTAQAVTGPYDQRGGGFARVVNGMIDIGAFEVQPSSPPPSPTSSGGTTTSTPTPPSMFQAVLSLYIDGAAWEAFNLSWQFIYGDDFNIDNYFGTPSQLTTVRANAAGVGINYDAVVSLNAFLGHLRGYLGIPADIAANVPYAGPFAEFAVIAGAEAVLQAVQL